MLGYMPHHDFGRPRILAIFFRKGDDASWVLGLGVEMDQTDFAEAAFPRPKDHNPSPGINKRLELM